MHDSFPPSSLSCLTLVTPAALNCCFTHCEVGRGLFNQAPPGIHCAKALRDQPRSRVYLSSFRWPASLRAPRFPPAPLGELAAGVLELPWRLPSQIRSVGFTTGFSKPPFFLSFSFSLLSSCLELCVPPPCVGDMIKWLALRTLLWRPPLHSPQVLFLDPLAHTDSRS